MKVVINFGHGPKNIGYDPGAIGPTGYKEASQNSEVGSKLVQKLKSMGWEILALQDGDLRDITDQANAWKPDFFLSLHANASVPEAHGIETYALAPGGKGEKIAQEIQKELVAATGLANRGVKFANFYVLRETHCPAVLTELGFISSPAEEALMKQDGWDDLVATAICRAMSRAVSQPIKVTAAALNFTYPNNAKVVNDNLTIRDANGHEVPGEFVTKGNDITVLDVSYSKQLVLLEYLTPSGVSKGYVANAASCLQYYHQGKWLNGSTPEPVMDESGVKIGALDPREQATPIYRKNGKLHVVYSTDKGINTKSGYVTWDGGFQG